MFGVLALMLLACGADAQNRRTPAPSDAPSQARTIAATAPLKFNSDRAWIDLERQVAFGPRPAGSPALAQTRQYIEMQLKAIDVPYREQTFDAMTPAGVIRMTNVIATIPGRRSERIAIATHYDTKRFAEFKFLGASDAASSTAAVLELARVLTNRRNEFTIELLFLDGEEAVNTEWRDPDNTYGSKYYVKAAQEAGTLSSLKALILLDMVGDRDLDIRPDSNSARWLNAIVWGSASRLGYSSTFIPDPFTVEDDHLPFVEAGVQSIDIIDLDYPQWHTAQDDLDHVSARSLQTVGDVVLDALPEIEKQLAMQP
jgi:Zn-dependent M28 family amino/carboxypeptidase